MFGRDFRLWKRRRPDAQRICRSTEKIDLTGHVHGETDAIGFNIARDPVHVHDLNATLLHLLGLDHTRLTYRFQGRDFRLTDVHGHVVRDVLA